MTDYLFTMFGSAVVRFRDLLDILIVAYVIYRVFLLIKGTIAMQMVLALGILFGLFKVSDPQYLDLKTLHWLLSNFWSIALLAVIVLFQPEIRRGLVQLGRQRFFKRSVVQDEALIEAVGEAAGVFSSSHTGALIVFERGNGLDNIKELSTTIDAEVTSELLRTVFFPHSPLHDGAVIIKDGRLAAAGCFLPLSKNPYLSPSYGTRHRAALGITEDTDAVVVIVSEETGTMSVVHGGKLEVQDTAAQLCMTLRRLFGMEALSL
ncbi:diadenylate cyclase CdaA [bacterium]|nr:diadenylate cyclase CdaA [candidate division CSSED10-310 bacterium]